MVEGAFFQVGSDDEEIHCNADHTVSYEHAISTPIERGREENDVEDTNDGIIRY